MSTAPVQHVYTIRRKVFALFSPKFHIYDEAGTLIGFCKQKAFKLKEDIRVFTDESMSVPLLSIQARNIIDFSAAYDIFDQQLGQSLGAVRRKGFSSLLRDSWEVLAQSDMPAARVQEDSMFLALLRRYLVGGLVPQRFILKNDTTEFAKFSSNFNPFVQKLRVEVYEGCPVAPMVVLGTAILLLAIEGRQG